MPSELDNNAALVIAQERGAEAYWAYAELDADPYPMGSPESNAWRSGYLAAEESEG